MRFTRDCNERRDMKRTAVQKHYPQVKLKICPILNAMWFGPRLPIQSPPRVFSWPYCY